jgi:hypothetical protein
MPEETIMHASISIAKCTKSLSASYPIRLSFFFTKTEYHIIIMNSSDFNLIIAPPPSCQ